MLQYLVGEVLEEEGAVWWWWRSSWWMVPIGVDDVAQGKVEAEDKGAKAYQEED